MVKPSSSGGEGKGKGKADAPTRKPKRKIRGSTSESPAPPAKKAALDTKMLEAAKKGNLLLLNDDAPFSKAGKKTGR